jgi:hypothetical protein
MEKRNSLSEYLLKTVLVDNQEIEFVIESATKRRVFSPILKPDFIPEMEALCICGPLLSAYKSAQRYRPEDNIDIFTAVRMSNLTCFVLNGFLFF